MTTIIDTEPGAIASRLRHRQRAIILKVRKYNYRATSFKSRGKCFKRIWTLDGIHYEDERLSYALVTPLFDLKLIVLNRDILQLTPLGGLVAAELNNKKRKATPTPVRYQQDESGQWNMDL